MPRPSDYARENRKTRPNKRGRTMKIAKLPTQAKTKRRKCFMCQRMDAKQIRVSANETRFACPIHSQLIIRALEGTINNDKPTIIKASKLWRKKDA